MLLRNSFRYSRYFTQYSYKCSSIPLFYQNSLQFNILSRNYCINGIPKVEESEISDKVRDVADRLLKLDFIGLCQFLDQIKEKSGVDPNNMPTAAGGGGGGAAANEAKQVEDTGFRKVSIREYSSGTLPVKEKFAIMKLMRAEQPNLSLADCKTRLDKVPCVIFDKIEKEKAVEIEDQLKSMPIVLIAEPV